MSRLIQLGSGDWIDPAVVIVVRVVGTPADGGGPDDLAPRVAIHVPGGALFVDDAYPTFAAAEEARDALAAAINAADGRP